MPGVFCQMPTAGCLSQALPFVHPAMAGIALSAGLIPVLVHLINRRRYVRVRWAAMPFLLAARRCSARRMRLEQILLLSVRVMVMVLLGLALARPYLRAAGLPAIESSGVHRVVLLDNSLSMSADTGAGATRFELAKRYAEALLDSFPAPDAVSLVTLADPAEAVIARGSYDRRSVRERLGAVPRTQRATDTLGALRAAAEILKTSEAAPGNRAVYLISDLPRSVWESAAPHSPPTRGLDVARASSASAPLQPVPTGAVRALRQLADSLADPAAGLNVARVAGDVTGNVAVTRLATESAVSGVNLPVRIIVDVTNFGFASVSDVVLQIRSDGRIIRRRRLQKLEPRQSVDATITTQFASGGTHLIEARLSMSTGQAQDALAIDNTRYLSIEVRETTPVLLVDGRPGSKPLAGEAGFLATALAPGVPAGALGAGAAGSARSRVRPTLVKPRVVSEPELSGEPLGDYEIVALCNVPRLSATTWSQLETFVGHGGGLLVFVGDLVSVDNYNRFGHREGAGLLPGRLGRSRSPTRADGSDPGRDAAGDVRVGLELTDPVHPIVAEFAAQPDSSLFSARMDRYLSIALDEHRAEVVLRYTNGDPALAASTYVAEGVGRGRVLLFTTTADLAWNNLAAKGDFVSLVLNAVAYLSPRRGEHRNINVGERVFEPLTVAESSLPLRVTTAEGGTAEPALVPDGEGLALTYGPVERARAISVSIGSRTRAFASNVDPAESDLEAIESKQFITELDRPVRVTEVVDSIPFGDLEPAAAGSTELASVALCLVLGLLLLEVWLAMRFGFQRA